MLPKDALEMPMLVVPPVELVTTFTAFAGSVHEQVEKNKQQHPCHPVRLAAAKAAERGVERGAGCSFSINRVNFSLSWHAALYSIQTLKT